MCLVIYFYDFLPKVLLAKAKADNKFYAVKVLQKKVILKKKEVGEMLLMVVADLVNCAQEVYHPLYILYTVHIVLLCVNTFIQALILWIFYLIRL